MKSPMVSNAPYIADKGNYTKLQVCESAAGFYIGTLYWNMEYEMWEPGSRDSEYFRTEKEAADYLKELEEMGPEAASLALRDHP